MYLTNRISLHICPNWVAIRQVVYTARGLHSKRSVMQAINLPGAGSLKRPDHILLDPITDKAQRTVSTVLSFY